MIEKKDFDTIRKAFLIHLYISTSENKEIVRNERSI